MLSISLCPIPAVELPTFAALRTDNYSFIGSFSFFTGLRSGLNAFFFYFESHCIKYYLDVIWISVDFEDFVFLLIVVM